MTIFWVWAFVIVVALAVIVFLARISIYLDRMHVGVVVHLMNTKNNIAELVGVLRESNTQLKRLADLSENKSADHV